MNKWKKFILVTGVLLGLVGLLEAQTGPLAAQIQRIFGRNNTWSGTNTFTGTVTITGTSIENPIELGTAGVRLTGDGDGAVTFLGLGDGFDEDITLNLDDTTNTAVFTSSTGVVTANFSGIALQESGIGVLNNDEIDASS